MTRGEAIDAALEAIDYVLANDDEYIGERFHRRLVEAMEVLTEQETNAPVRP